MKTFKQAIMILPLVCLGIRPAPATEPVHYRWTPETEFAYEITIVADEPDDVATLKGVIEYKVNEDKLSYEGGLKKTVKKKTQSSSLRRPGFPFPMGPRAAFGAGGGPGPFSRRVNPFKGLERTSNQLELNELGYLISLEGTSHLPYLIGHLSLLPFEPLGEPGEENWEVISGMQVTEAKDRVESIIPFGGPFRRRPPDSEGKKTLGAQINTYQLLKDDGKTITVKKATHLTTQEGTDGETVSVEGLGTWVFDREAGLPQSADFAHRINYASKHHTLTVPVTIRYQRMSEQALIQLRQKRVAEAARRKAEHEKRIAEQQAKAAAPLTAEERAATFKELASRSARVLRSRLKMLNGKEPTEPDPELAAALQPLIGHVEKDLRETAENVLAKVSPEFEARHLVVAAYRRGDAVEETPFPIAPELELPLGLIVLYRERNQWAPGRVIGETEAGEIELRQVRWPHRDRTAPRSDLRLPDRRAEQPHVSFEIMAQLYGGTGTFKPAPRVWTDDTGSFQLEGEFLEQQDGIIHLKLKDGRKARVPLEKLSAPDRDYLLRIQSKPRKANPFVIDGE
ncbi:MAG: SHD1 domain-containing protein [Verrucomicrobiota bacterium]